MIGQVIAGLVVSAIAVAVIADVYAKKEEALEREYVLMTVTHPGETEAALADREAADLETVQMFKALSG